MTLCFVFRVQDWDMRISCEFPNFEFAMTAELKKWRALFTGLASIWSNKFTKSNEKKTCLLLYHSIVFIQISNTYLPEFLNILLYVEVNPVWNQYDVNVCIQW